MPTLMQCSRAFFVLAILLLTGGLAWAQTPLTTAFTYQGELVRDGAPAEGPHDLRFELYNDALGGQPIGGVALCFNDVPVANGRFSLTLDFGQVLDGSRRFLQLQVRADTTRVCPDLAGFTILGPRQELTIAPHAGYALRSGNATLLGGQPLDFFTNASNLASGILADARVPSSIPRLSTPNTFTQNTTFQSAFTGIRRSSPITTAEVFGIQGNDDGDDNAYTGMYIRSNFASSRPFYGMITSVGDVAWTYLDGSTASWRVNVAGQDRMTVASGGNVGIGTTNPAARLEVNGDIRLGTNGTLRAAAGEENLRVIRGRINANGTVFLGSGFTCSRFGAGSYRITFSTPFPAAPSVTVTNFTTTSSSNSIPSMNASVVDIQTYNSAGVLTDTQFNFIAVGPR